jgi:lipopolysaccharide/colanic/teichoic acid biosynthesis glycosyltransferase
MASIPTSKYLEQLVTSPQGFGFQVYLSLKRLFDVVISIIFLLILSPVMLLIAIGIKLDSKGPVIFSQIRIGSKPRWLDGKLIFDLCPFAVYKFRTMYCDASEDNHREFIQAFIRNDQSGMKELQTNSNDCSSAYKLSDDPRVTGFGKLLRKSSLDELPQFWNILKNDMSLVGPRPALPYEVKMYQDWHYERLQAKPGLTGLWQVTARSSVEFDDMVKLDIQYVKERSLLKDLWIILKTPFVVISGKGAA